MTKVKILFALVIVAVALTVIAPTVLASGTSKPVVSELQFGQAAFAVQTTVKSKASVKSGVRIFLNVQAKPMTRKQRRHQRCFSKRPGTWFKNEVVDPYTGRHYFVRMQVKAGDNHFCRDRNGKVRKVSCGNEAVFEEKKPRLPVFHGKFKIQDYLNVLIESVAKAKVHASALASCSVPGASASASVSANGLAVAKTRFRLKVRSQFQAKARGRVRSLRFLSRQRLSLAGQAKNQARVEMSGKAQAFCISQPLPKCVVCVPPPCQSSCQPPPPKTCPSGQVPAPGGGCKDSTQTPPPPPEVPGPNPPPNGGPSDPGSHQCYDENDNHPVDAVDGLCPPGSYGE